MKHRLHLVYREDVLPAERKLKMKWFRILGLLLALAVCQRVQAQTATVTWATTHQTIDGFGGGSMGDMSAMSSANLNFFYGTGSNDIGLSLLRIRVAQSTNDNCYGPNGTESNGTSCVSVDDITNAKNVIALGGKIWASAEEAPTQFTAYSATPNPSYYYVDNPTNNAAWAALQADWVAYANSLGVPIYAFSPLQEPDDTCPSNQQECTTMAAKSFADYIPNLSFALSSAGLGSVKILAPEVCCVEGNYGPEVGNTPGAWFNTIMTSSAASDVGILAMHGYGHFGCTPVTANCGSDFFPTSAPDVYGLHYWMTEVSDSGTLDTSMASGITYALSIHDWLANANASAYLYWLVDCSGQWFRPGGFSNINWCLTDDSGNPTKRAYVFGNWSKFVRPGWVRIDTTANPQSGVYVTAFKSPNETSFTIVAVNTNSSSTSQTFTLTGFPGATSVTPWVTSSTLSLAGQSSVAVDSNSFSFSLAAQSVTTFVGSTSGSSAGTPVAPPTGLRVSVN
jgi:O-glycosyl hydrolase